jgi:hypothetical protein
MMAFAKLEIEVKENGELEITVAANSTQGMQLLIAAAEMVKAELIKKISATAGIVIDKSQEK